MGTEEHPDNARTEHLQPLRNVMAMGDCCAHIGAPLPALAQVRSWRIPLWGVAVCQACGDPIAAVLPCTRSMHGLLQPNSSFCVSGAHAQAMRPALSRSKRCHVQVAEQQGRYLAKRLNQMAEAPAGIELKQDEFQCAPACCSEGATQLDNASAHSSLHCIPACPTGAGCCCRRS